MNANLIFSMVLTLISLTSFAQEMSSADNQCRIQAKEIALQTYQTCVSESKTAKIDLIKKEYQEKITELKKQYEAQIVELKSAPPVTQVTQLTTPQTDPDEVPMTIEPVKKSDTVESKELSLTEPTVTLRPANPKQVKKEKRIVKPVVAQKRAKGEKGVKGIAKTLPLKQQNNEAKLISKKQVEATDVLKVDEPLVGAQTAETESSQQ